MATGIANTIANDAVKSIASNATKSTGSGLLSSLTGGASPLGLATDLVGLVGSLGIGGSHPDSPQKYAASQEADTTAKAETLMNRYRQAAAEGNWDQVAAIKSALQTLAQTALATAYDESTRRAAQKNVGFINQLVSEIDSNIGQNYTNTMYTPGASTLTGSESMQKERGRTLLRNMLQGTESGKAFGENTVAGKLIAPRADVGQQYSQYLSQVAKPRDTAAGDQLGQQIMGSLSQFGNVPKKPEMA